MPLAGFAPVDFAAFHREVLPPRLASSARAARVVAGFGSLALRTRDGVAFKYAVRDGEIGAVPGDASADIVIELDREDWQGLVYDYEAAAGLQGALAEWPRAAALPVA